MEIGQILNEIKNDPIYLEAISNGIDVEKTLLENFEKWKRYTSVKTVVSYARSELNRKIQSKNDVPLVGISVGQCDRYGTKIPVTFPILSSDGKHFAGVNYDVNKIPSPGRVELKVRKNDKYINYNITDVVKFEPLNRNEIIERLMRVSKTPETLNFMQLEKNQILVVRGIIGWVNPAKKFDDNRKVSGSYEVYLTTEDTVQRFTPVVDITLQKTGTNSVIFQLHRQRFARPIYDIVDFNAMCHSAVNETPDPNEQAKIIKSGLTDRMIIGVGEVTGLKAGDKGNFINMRMFAIYEYDSSFMKDSPQLDAYDKPAPAVSAPAVSAPAVSAPAVPAPAVSAPAVSAPAVPAPAVPTPAREMSPESKRTKIEKIAEQLKTISRAFDRSIGSFKPDEVRKLLKIDDDIPDAVIDQAITVAILPKGDD
jgi:hypothetical protein